MWYSYLLTARFPMAQNLSDVWRSCMNELRIQSRILICAKGSHLWVPQEQESRDDPEGGVGLVGVRLHEGGHDVLPWLVGPRHPITRASAMCTRGESPAARAP